MGKGTVEKRALTDDEIADSKRLKSLWEEFKQKDAKRTQTWLASETGLGKQSLMGQYINGNIQLNERAVLAFSRVMGIHPSEISPRMDFPAAQKKEESHHIRLVQSNPLSEQYIVADEIILLISLFRNCTPTARKMLLGLAMDSDKVDTSLRRVEVRDQV